MISAPRKLALVAALFPLLYSSGTGQAQSGEAPNDIESCVRAQGSLSVLFLVDTSQSPRTDPSAERVAGLEAAVEALESISNVEEGIEPTQVYVEFADFGTSTRRSFPGRPEWQQLAGEEGGLSERMAEFAERNASEDTDYVAALDPWLNRGDPLRPGDEIGAIELLERAPAGSCRLLVWFTDGQFDIDYQGTSKDLHWTEPPIVVDAESVEAGAESLGIDRLCAVDGHADTLRSGSIVEGSGAFLTVVALGDTDSFDLIRAVALGQGSAGPCGGAPARGDFVRADSLGALIFGLVDSVIIDVLPPGDYVTCAESRSEFTPVVERCEIPFELSAGIRAFNLLTLAGDPLVRTLLITPTGEVIDLRTSEVLALENGARLEIKALGPDGDVFKVAGDLPTDGRWAGVWRIRFESTEPGLAEAAVNKASMYLFGRNLTARLKDSTNPLRVGRSSTLTVQLVTPGDEPATDAAFIGGSKIEVLANGEPVELSAINPNGTFDFVYDVPENFAGDRLEITAVLNPIVRLSPEAPIVELPEWSGVLGSLEVLPIPQYPLIDRPDGLDRELKNSDDTAENSATLVIPVDATAPDAGGCVTLTSLDLPVGSGLIGAATVTLTVDGQELELNQECALELAQGERADIDATISVRNVKFDEDDFSADSARVMTGVAVFESRSTVDPSQHGATTLELWVAVIPTISEPVEWARVILSALLALLAPIVLLYLVNYLAARLAVDRASWVSLPVRLVDGQLLRKDGSPLVIVDQDVEVIGLPEEGRHREVNIGDFEFKARMPLNPLKDVYAQVRRAGCAFVVAEEGSSKRGDAGLTPVSLAGAWAFASTGLPVEADGGGSGGALFDFGDSAPHAATIEPLDGELLMLAPPLRSTEYLNKRIGEATPVIRRTAASHAQPPAAPDGVDEPEEDGAEPGVGDHDPLTNRSGAGAESSTAHDPLSGSTASTADTTIDPLTGKPMRSTAGVESSTKKRRRRPGRRPKAPSDDPPSTGDTGPQTPF